ncbi:MAG: hypothetical protein P9X24_08720 [Candidatus Hatepunaea meridiana]|nr:hypothetical protein [Candidatus Hatepunaea meridiana]
MKRFGFYFRRLSILLLPICLFSSIIFADEAWNVELVHRTACNFRPDYNDPLWDVQPGMLLYGDNKIIERLLPDDDGLFTATGMFICDSVESMLTLAYNDEIALVGYDDGLGTFDYSNDAPRLIRKFDDGRSHQTILINGSLAVTNSSDDPDEETNEIRFYDISDHEEIEFLGSIEGEFLKICLGDGLLTASVRNEGLSIYDISDPAHPRLATQFELDIFEIVFSMAGGILAIGQRRPERGIELYDFSNPDEPVSIALLLEDECIRSLSAFPGYLTTVTYGGPYVFWCFNINDPDNPQLLGTIDGFITDDVRLINEELFCKRGGKIVHLIPDDHDSFEIAHTYQPPSYADEIIKRDNRLVTTDWSRVLVMTLQPPDRPRVISRSYIPAMEIFRYCNQMITGRSWLAVGDHGEGSAFAVIFRWGDQGLSEEYRLLEMNDSYLSMMNIDDKLALEVNDRWNIYDLDRGDEPELIGETELPLSGGSAFRDGYLYCVYRDTLRVFEVIYLPDMELVAEVAAEGDRVFLYNDVAFVTGEDGFRMIDICNPEEPERIERYEIERGARQMAFSGDLGSGN